MIYEIRKTNDGGHILRYKMDDDTIIHTVVVEYNTRTLKLMFEGKETTPWEILMRTLREQAKYLPATGLFSFLEDEKVTIFDTTRALEFIEKFDYLNLPTDIIKMKRTFRNELEMIIG